MNLFLKLAFLFFIGSTQGWILELLFRRYISSSNPERKWINPGFCIGPYLPIYGVGICILFLISYLKELLPISNDIMLILVMGICMTAMEYIAGLISLKLTKVRLWDYSKEWGNIQGIICPKFFLVWTLLGAIYYYFIHPYILNALKWFSGHPSFSFVIGLFFGVFIIDAVYSSQLVIKLKQYAEENGVIVKYENLKAYIRSVHDKTAQKSHFFFSFRSERPLTEYLKGMMELLESYKKTKR